ncbi:Lrp/AsnC family transcriptional regulator [Neptunomonas sp. XY-337]|uniref:Lrp/AsnC family transcriptional regulator n=1 Tax=Neptunomonas sp. XY-337 TaxID=2561897 RepID=UPI0010AA35BF|nr:Lrp/AsnC family transcriptional regulator [Neptunomonas sp. XY-337]
MDKFDQAILAVLSENARTSVSAIAERVNLSRSAVTERIRRMEQMGEIRGYRVERPPYVEGEAKVQAYLEVTQKGYRCEEIAARLLSLPGVTCCHGVSGEVDLFAFVETTDMQQLHELRYQIDQLLPSDVTVTTHVVMREWR